MLRRYVVMLAALIMGCLALGLLGCSLSSPPTAPSTTPTAGDPGLDRTVPQIEVFAPLVRQGSAGQQRGFDVVRKPKQLMVHGRVTDTSGIVELLVNGRRAQVNSQNGEFRVVVPLAAGEKTIRIRATDTRNNVADLTFVIVGSPDGSR